VEKHYCTAQHLHLRIVKFLLAGRS
jgi:subtilisin family serine protease